MEAVINPVEIQQKPRRTSWHASSISCNTARSTQASFSCSHARASRQRANSACDEPMRSDKAQLRNEASLMAEHMCFMCIIDGSAGESHVREGKFELDSLMNFLRLSRSYFTAVKAGKERQCNCKLIFSYDGSPLVFVDGADVSSCSCCSGGDHRIQQTHRQIYYSKTVQK